MRTPHDGDGYKPLTGVQPWQYTVAMIDLFLATTDGLDEPDPDREPLDAALQAAGIRSQWRSWRDPMVDWSAARLCYPRATWDYHLDRPGFLAWAARVDAVTRLRNPLSVVEWNTEKTYLVELAEAGIPVVPTRVVRRGTRLTLDEVRRAEGWGAVVTKPTVSCSSWETYRFEPAEDGLPHWGRLVGERDMMVQPWIASVETVGERSIVVIGGEATHVVRKSPRLAGGIERVTGPFEPSADEIAVVGSALDHVGERLDYARVDLVTDASGAPMIAELELVEPSLFFAFSERATQRFVAIVERHLQQS